MRDLKLLGNPRALGIVFFWTVLFSVLTALSGELQIAALGAGLSFVVALIVAFFDQEMEDGQATRDLLKHYGVPVALVGFPKLFRAYEQPGACSRYRGMS